MESLNRRPKRKSRSQEIIFEISDDDMSPEPQCDSDSSEPLSKIRKSNEYLFEATLENSNSNLKDDSQEAIVILNDDSFNDSVQIIDEDRSEEITVINIDDSICSDKEISSDQTQTQDSDRTQDLEVIKILQKRKEEIESNKNPKADSVEVETEDTCDNSFTKNNNSTEKNENVSQTCETDTTNEITEEAAADSDCFPTENDNEKSKEDIEIDNDTNITLNNTSALKEDNSCIFIKFSDDEMASLYKIKFLKFIQSFIELSAEEQDNLNIKIRKDTGLNPKEWVVLDNTICANLNTEEQINPVDVTEKQTKKKKKKSKKSKELFVLDLNPSENSSESCTKYLSKFQINTNESNSERNEVKVSCQVCFNCEMNHALKDCPVPKDFGKINAARNKFKATKQTVRYHLEEEQKYSHLAPGKVSEKLREALGLRKNQLPPFIYSMRRLGYPPGWLEEAKVQNSTLAMFDSEGNSFKDVKKRKSGLDPEKVVDYPGFNVALPQNAVDENRMYGVPPYSEQFSKRVMIEYFDKQALREQDDTEPCDMDLDLSNVEIGEKTMVEVSNEKIKSMESSLLDLEKQKLLLLAALNDNSSSKDGEECEKFDKKTENRIKLEEIVEKTIKVDQKIEEDEICKNVDDESELKSSEDVKTENSPEQEENSPTSDLKADNFDCEMQFTPKSSNSVARRPVKTSTFGTPILKSNSPYSCLPNADNFMKDISPVINFENLPNSTGKYEQMTEVLQKVRNSLKNFNT